MRPESLAIRQTVSGEKVSLSLGIWLFLSIVPAIIPIAA
jgi:hypothetical protein